jgi:hypothetical protein
LLRVSGARLPIRFRVRLEGETMTTTPHINLKGTPPGELLQDYLLAIAALRGSYLAMAAPNRRDYQTAPMGTFARAKSEHRARLARLECQMSELEVLTEHISDQR